MLEHLRATPAVANRKFVLTSTNPLRVSQIANPKEPVLEIIGKPYDLGVIVDAVRAALGQRMER